MRRFKKRYLIIAGILLIPAIIAAAAYGSFHIYYGKMNIQPLERNFPLHGAFADTDGDSVIYGASEGSDGGSVIYGASAGTDGDSVINGTSADANSDSSDAEIQSYENYLKRNLKEQAEELPYDSENVYHILLIGTDARRADQSSRSDSMIIVSINRETEKIIMTSVMRDIYCTVPGIGNTRINHANAYGGVSLLLDTIEYNLGIHIDDYALIDFGGFMNAVDAVGGIEMEVSADEITEMNDWMIEINTLLGQEKDADNLRESDAGTLLLNGKQALVFSRIRYTGNSDFERTSRQRRVLTAIFKKAKSLSLPELNDLMNAVLPCVTTNLTQGEVLSLLLHSGEYLDYELVSSRIPVDGSWKNLRIRGMAVLGIDFAENKDLWYELVYGEQQNQGGTKDGGQP